MEHASTSLARANSLTGQWRDFGAWLKRPTLPPRAAMPNGASLMVVLRMLALDLLFMSVLIAVGFAVLSSGVELPETALAGMKIGPAIVAAVVIGAPLLEEIAFRGWLSGRPGHLLAILLLGAGIGVAGLMTGGNGAAPASPTAALAILVGVLLALFALHAMRRRDAMGWFAKLYPVFFWLSTLAFATVHLFNFDDGAMLMALPLVLPQFVLGTILAYLRVHHGLWASVLLHMLHNSAFITLVALAGEAG